MSSPNGFQSKKTNIERKSSVMWSTFDRAKTILKVIGDSPWRLVLNSFDDLRFLTSENDTFDGATFIEDDDEDDVAGDDVELMAKTTDRHKDIFVAPRVCNVFLRGHDDKFVSTNWNKKNQWSKFFSKMGHPRPLFFIFVFSIHS